MSTPSSLYAEKIFSEHPIAFWPLDDKADYVSLISETNRNLSLWDIENGSAQLVVNVLDEPFPQSHVSKVSASTASDSFYVSAVSPNLINLSSLNQSLATFAIGTYIYNNSSYISGFEIGYQYFDPSVGNLVEKTKFFSTEVSKRWIFISETFDPPSSNVSARIVIKAKFFGGDDLENYNFLVNGISFGQWSEEFNSSSLGVSPVIVPENIFNESDIEGIPAKAYGLQDLDGYYLLKTKALSAKNSSIPMVFGATNTTILQPGDEDMPSLIIPSQGFLNESGKYKDYTIEFWAKINSDTVEERRIFGTIGTMDGLFVKGSGISLKINNYVIRHYVGEWYRPMLIQIRYSQSSISLVINGEQVGESFIDAESLIFPTSTYSIGQAITENEWLGFWSYADVTPIEIDGVAIYGYKVPNEVAKRRYIYGQGVEFPENINNAYSGSSFFIDYPFAKYAKNYSYPNLGKWRQGAYDNLSLNNNALSFPDYKLPEIKFSGNRTVTQWLADLSDAQDESEFFIKLRPNNSWNSINSHIFFKGVSLSNEDIKGFYVMCKEMQLPTSRQTILAIENRVLNNTFEISIDQNGVNYSIFENGIEHVIASKSRKSVGEKSVFAIDIKKFSEYYGDKVAQFFGKISSPDVYVGSRKDMSQMFLGNIYSIGFCSLKNISKISSAFDADGLSFSDTFVDAAVFLPEPSTEETPYTSTADAGLDVSNSAVFQFIYDGGALNEYSEFIIESHTPSYGISLGRSIQNPVGVSLLIASESSWQDYVPLSFFAKDALNSRGDSISELDFIQFNINYPAPSAFIRESVPGSWTYAELQEEYANPIQRTYESLDNQLFTGFESYEDLKNRSSSTYKYDTSNSVVKTYITFQLLRANPNRQLSAFVNTELAPKNGIVVPGEDWINTKYEVVDNMIIYPPTSLSFDDLAIVTHIEFSTKSIVDNPISIRSLEYASMSLSDTVPTAIGTRFGNDIYPYRKEGFYFTYKKQNPFSIYKGSSPYLYLTRNSGITIRGTYDPLVNRGISLPINRERAENFKVIAMQIAMRFDQDFFPYAPMQIFELQSKNSYIRVYAVATHPSGKRAKLYAINSRGELENGLAFYLNGKLVKDPTITIKEWAMLGIRFANTQEFGGYGGALRLTGPLTFNNMSYYKSTNLQEVTETVERPWYKVQFIGPLELDWGFWNPAYLWNGVLIISETSYYGVDPSDIYKIYTGTNKIIIDDEIETQFGDYSYTIAEDIIWRSQVYQPV